MAGQELHTQSCSWEALLLCDSSFSPQALLRLSRLFTCCSDPQICDVVLLAPLIPSVIHSVSSLAHIQPASQLCEQAGVGTNCE